MSNESNERIKAMKNEKARELGYRSFADMIIRLAERAEELTNPPPTPLPPEDKDNPGVLIYRRWIPPYSR